MAMFKIPHVLEMDQVYLKLELQEIVFELNIAYAIIIFFLFIAGHFTLPFPLQYSYTI